MEKWLLKLVHLFDNLFIRQGIDIYQMYTIVETKMTMDKRRVYMSWRQSSQSENTNHLAMVLGGYLLFGAVVAIIIFVVPSFISAMILMHAYVIFMMCMTLIGDFTAILLDTTDSQIILPKPVNGRTLFMARQVHIALYLLQFTIALGLLPVIAISLKFSILAGIASVLTIVLCVLLAIATTYCIYLLFLRFSSQEKIREWINWLQIIMTILFVTGYQIMMRLSDMVEYSNGLQLHWYSYLLPPVWMAIALESVYTLRVDRVHVVMIILALTIPLLFYWLLNKYLAPVFAAKLSLLNAGIQADQKPIGSGGSKKSISNVLSAWFTSSPVSKAAFELVWKITGRDKSFKLQFYPLFGYTVVFLLVFVLSGTAKGGVSFNEISTSMKYLWFIYFPIVMISSAIILVSMNENFAASWIYYAAPVKKPGELILGSLHALFVKYFLPLYAMLFAVCLYIWKQDIIDDFIFGLTNTYLFVLIASIILEKHLPFSQQPSTTKQAGRTIMVLIQMIVAGIMVGIHYLISKTPGLFYILIPAEIVLCWLIRRELRNLPWKKISE